MGENPLHPTVVITGATGRIGRMMQAFWKSTPPVGHKVIWSARQLPAARAGNWLEWDLSQGPADLPPGCIILHLAAAIQGDAGRVAQNIAFAKNVLKSAAMAKAQGILFASSIAVLGPSDDPLSEAMPPAPVSDYAKAKLGAEQVFVAGNTDCPVSILRIANVVGADALLAAAESGMEVTLDPVPNQKGGPIRTWIGPFTLAKALSDLISIVTKGQSLPGVLNLACQPPIAMADILDASGHEWRFGDVNPAVNARSVVPTEGLYALVDMPQVTPASLIAEWNAWRRSDVE